MILVNGEPVDTVPADDRGLAYGDGLFETLRARSGSLPLLDYHLDRLFAGLHALGFPGLSREMVCDELGEAARAEPDGVVKLIVTRGSGARGYRLPVDREPRRIVMTAPVSPDLAAWQTEGVALRVCTTLLEGPSALDGVKHLNRLSQVLARAEWDDPGIHEGLMRDAKGRIVEGTMSNLFAVRGKRLLTPPIGSGCGAGVHGVMRRLALERAKARGIECHESFLADDELETADELFITNGVIGVCPVRQLASASGKRTFGIGTMTRLLQAETENELERRTCSDD